MLHDGYGPEASANRAARSAGEQGAEGALPPLTDFLVASVQEAAIETVRTHDALRLGERDRQAFVSALLAPPAPARTLEQAARRYRDRTGL